LIRFFSRDLMRKRCIDDASALSLANLALEGSGRLLSHAARALYRALYLDRANLSLNYCVAQRDTKGHNAHVYTCGRAPLFIPSFIVD